MTSFSWSKTAFVFISKSPVSAKQHCARFHFFIMFRQMKFCGNHERLQRMLLEFSPSHKNFVIVIDFVFYDQKLLCQFSVASDTKRRKFSWNSDKFLSEPLSSFMNLPSIIPDQIVTESLTLTKQQINFPGELSGSGVNGGDGFCQWLGLCDGWKEMNIAVLIENLNFLFDEIDSLRCLNLSFLFNLKFMMNWNSIKRWSIFECTKLDKSDIGIKFHLQQNYEWNSKFEFDC